MSITRFRRFWQIFVKIVYDVVVEKNPGRPRTFSEAEESAIASRYYGVNGKEMMTAAGISNEIYEQTGERIPESTIATVANRVAKERKWGK